MVLLSGHPGDAPALAPELVRKKWTYGKTGQPGRPPIDPKVAELVLKIARENPRWGCVRI